METVIVEVHQGKLRGINEKNINGMCFIAFRGVPYAKPPVGHLRFKDSEPMLPWSGVRDATKFNNRCAQHDWISRKIIGSDDCLYLNIYTPSLHPPTPKAVMVWIHGGSFLSGSGDDFILGPDYLIERDIVLVTINYRVGILGFLNVEDEEAPGNQGLKDQVLALKWIQQNIAHFGGDPNNVTISGHSAGGASVHYLTISQLAQGLFHKAIIQSGIATNPWASSPEPSIKAVKKLAKLFDKNIADVKEFVNYLRSLDAHYLVEAERKIRSHRDVILCINPFIPSLDLKAKTPFLTQPVEEAAKGGIKVPCICGYVSDEGLGLAEVLTKETYDKINADMENLLIHPNTIKFLEQHDLTIADVKRFHFGDENISSKTAEMFFNMLTTVHITLNIHDFIKKQSKIQNIPIYVYKFEYEIEKSVMKEFMRCTMKGTCHGDELSLLFYAKLGGVEYRHQPAQNSAEYRLIQRFTEMWSNFAKFGNPTPQTSHLLPIIWKPVASSGNFNYLKITDELKMEVEKDIIQQLIDSKQVEMGKFDVMNHSNVV